MPREAKDEEPICSLAMVGTTSEFIRAGDDTQFIGTSTLRELIEEECLEKWIQHLIYNDLYNLI